MIKEMVIEGKKIGDGHPCFIIAEAGANFKISDDKNINFKQALKLIDIAVEAKADSVKFQLYRAKKLYVKDAGCADYIGKKKPIYDIIKEMELPYEWLPKLKDYCDKKGIIFFASPFDIESVDELENVNVPMYKIASYSITDFPLLKYIASKGKPIILSTGASDLKEVKKAVRYIKKCGNKKIAVLQCTAKYPAPLSTINLKVLWTLKKEFGSLIGLSDHSREPSIAPMGAVALGAKIIEKHYTTDNNLSGPDHGFAILPEELKELVDNIRMLETALGFEKKQVAKSEDDLRNFARHYLYAIKDIKKGEAFSEKNMAALRPGKKEKGLEPEYYEALLGKKAPRNIKSQAPITKEMMGGRR